MRGEKKFRELVFGLTPAKQFQPACNFSFNVQRNISGKIAPVTLPLALRVAGKVGQSSSFRIFAGYFAACNMFFATCNAMLSLALHCKLEKTFPHLERSDGMARSASIIDVVSFRFLSFGNAFLFYLLQPPVLYDSPNEINGSGNYDKAFAPLLTDKPEYVHIRSSQTESLMRKITENDTDDNKNSTEV